MQYYLDLGHRLFNQCAGRLLKSSPPEVCDEVQELMRSLHMDTSHLLGLYNTFHMLAQQEEQDKFQEVVDKEVEELEAAGEIQAAAAAAERPLDVPIMQVAREIQADSMINLVPERARWVKKLLSQLMQMGDCEETVEWDTFLWITLRFCSLTRVELAQTLFLLIQRERNSPFLHYLTYQDLQDFYWVNYRLCPVKNFNTASIDFKKLPLTRYYMTDFTELCQRYTALLNPLLHLQQSLQSWLPNLEFWENLDRSAGFCRRITFEFFSMEVNRVHLYGEPPFRESCDMLAPEALGPQAVNQDQWVLRCKSKYKQGPMPQASVWGEQAPPELFDLLEKQRREREILRKKGQYANNLKDLFSDPKPAEEPAEAGQQPAATTTSAPPLPALASTQPQKALTAQAAAAGTGGGVAAGIKAGIQATVPSRPGQPAAPVDVASMTPMDMSIHAAVLNEENNPPQDILPPRWMKFCTVAPAPQIRGPDPPLPRTVGRTIQHIEGGGNSGAMAIEEVLPPGWFSAVDPSTGNTYYYNRELNITQWEFPESEW